jgi:predicted nuclease of predicted toxin-antitoxin system
MQLADVFPDSQHVFQLGLDRASDGDIWTYARDHEFIIVTKDADFSELSALRDFPPKIPWESCTTVLNAANRKQCLSRGWGELPGG